MINQNHAGDEGITKNYLGHPHPKSNQLIEAIGTLDELVAHLGLIKFIINDPEKYHLNCIQLQLMSCMSVLSGYQENRSYITTAGLEFLIEKYQTIIPAPKHFSVPGDHEIGIFTNIARTICRRAERRVVAINAPKNILQFLNRLSTYLFALQNYYEHQ